MLRSLPAHIVASLALFFATSHAQILAQSTPCPPPTALIAPDNPAYADAMDLANRLKAHGFVVNCIFPTKLGSIFEVADGDVIRSTVEGEANFDTNYGGIEVVFMPKPQTFADFKITERRKGGGYLYRFTGIPKVLAGDKFNFGSAYRNYFLKHDSYLFFLSDQTMLSRLQEALGPPTAP
jgi:hypothetical protein